MTVQVGMYRTTKAVRFGSDTVKEGCWVQAFNTPYIAALVLNGLLIEHQFAENELRPFTSRRFEQLRVTDTGLSCAEC